MPSPSNQTLTPLRDRDQAIVAAAVSGGPEADVAYRKLIERYGPLVLSSCTQLLGKEAAEADEAAQDVWIQVHRSLPKFEGRSTFRTWLFSVVSNVCRQRRRSLARQSVRRTAVSDFVSEKAETERAEAPALSQARQSIDEALHQLPEDKQRIIVLRFISGLSIDEIAGVLEVKLSTAKMRLYRAIDALREVYKDVGPAAFSSEDPLVPPSWIQFESEIRHAGDSMGKKGSTPEKKDFL